MTQFGNLLFAGLVSGAVYGVFAVCLCMLFRVSLVLNLAVGDFAMLGALGVDSLVRDHGMALALALPLVLLAIAAFSWLYDVVVLRTALKHGGGHEGIFVIFFFTLALSFFIEGVSRDLFGLDAHSAPALWPGTAIDLGGVHVQRAGALILAAALIAGVALAVYLRSSLFGKAMTASGENTLGARMVGIAPSGLRRATFVGMAVLAAVFGIILSPLSGFTYATGSALSMSGLIAAALAGLMSPGRAVVAGLGIGIGEAMIGGYLTTQYQLALVYGALIVLILARPQLLGSAAETSR